MAFKDHFSDRAAGYARARPRYPPQLFSALAGLTGARRLAWDCGTGNGQAAIGLAEHFDRVHATDASAAQLRQAEAHPRIRYEEAPESASGLAGHSADLVTVAQAAHWFDLDAFYREVNRVLRPGGVLALWCYRLCRIDPLLDALVERFYTGTVGAYWPAERRLVDAGYRTLALPYPEEPFPDVAMELTWSLADFTAYVRTWSAVSEYQKRNGADPVTALHQELATVWGDPEKPRRVAWPLTGRIGRRPAELGIRVG